MGWSSSSLSVGPDTKEDGNSPRAFRLMADLHVHPYVVRHVCLYADTDPVRIQLLSIVASKGEVCSCDLIRPVAKSQPTISHHTTILANAGILIGEKRGRWTRWRVAPESLDDVRRAMGDARA
jgi:ArsR family transcriptional regulator